MDLDLHLNFRPFSAGGLEQGVGVERHIFLESGNAYS